MLRKICGLNMEEVTGDWRKLHNEMLYDSHSPPNSIWAKTRIIVRWVGYVAHIGEERGAYRDLVGRPEGKTPL